MYVISREDEFGGIIPLVAYERDVKTATNRAMAMCMKWWSADDLLESLDAVGKKEEMLSHFGVTEEGFQAKTENMPDEDWAYLFIKIDPAFRLVCNTVEVLP